MRVIVSPDPAALAAHAAEVLADRIRTSPGERVTLALAGGSTPVATYRRMRELDVPWERVHAWIGDERFVPADHPDNNGAMAMRELIDGTRAAISLVPWRPDASPHEIAAEYERTVLEVLEHDATGPRPDIVLAGIGDDGHTLSLFPGTDALDVTDRWYVANWVEQKDTWRLTATYPLAHRARLVVVLVAGSGKAGALREILEPSGDPRLPAARLMDGEAEVLWLVDEAAAAELGDTPTEPA